MEEKASLGEAGNFPKFGLAPTQNLVLKPPAILLSALPHKRSHSVGESSVKLCNWDLTELSCGTEVKAVSVSGDVTSGLAAHLLVF